MIPGNVDPRRPDRVQRYKATHANGNQSEDLTPDYMNILGQESAVQTGNVPVPDPMHHDKRMPEHEDSVVQHHPYPSSSLLPHSSDTTTTSTNHVIATSPQYGVAIMTTTTTTTGGDGNIPAAEGTVTPGTDSVVETTAKTDTHPATVDTVTVAATQKDSIHSTPSRNDRFKVVKIASLEPFRRGRWKCMDYVDENPPPQVAAAVAAQSKAVQSTTNIQMGGNVTAAVSAAQNMYMQTQSLPQQHFQQMLVQGFAAPAQPQQQQQFYPPPQQIIPTQSQQYYYAPQNVAPTNQPIGAPQFITTGQPTAYYAAPQSVVPPHTGAAYPPNYPPNVQYVATAAQVIPASQASAFVSATQNLPPSFQQSQTYAGPPTQPAPAQPPMVNGHAFPQQQQQDGQQVASTLPTQVAKNVILNNPVPQPQQQYAGNPQPQPAQSYTQPAQQMTAQQVAAYEAPTNVYTNPQFVASVISIPVVEQTSAEQQTSKEDTATPSQSSAGEVSDSNATQSEEKAGGTPIVNAIDNKIEQAMDLVKSHLMYTVREEVEVLKEKIAELMEKIQQLEAENSYLKQQIPKVLSMNPGGTPDSQPPSSTQQ